MKTLRQYILGVVLFVLVNPGYSQSSYAPDPTLRNSLRKEVWQRLKPDTPKNQRLLMGLVFGSNQVFVDYEKLARKNGFKPYEMATVASFFQVIGEEVSEGQEFSQAQIKAMHDKISLQYAQEGIDKMMVNQARQKKYDGLILKSYWLASMFKMAKNNSPQIQEIAKKLLQENPIGASTAAYAQSSPVPRKPDQETIGSSNPGPKGDADKKFPTLQSAANPMEGVEDVILRTVTSYGLNGVYVENEVSVLFKNGDIFTNPSGPLETLDIVGSKSTNPKKWDKWQKRGNVIYVTRSRNGKTYDWKKWFKVRPAKKGMRLNGKFNTLDPFGGSTVINASTVSFLEDGRFAWKTIKGGNTTWKPLYSERSQAGTYALDQYTITLNYNNGESESFFFGLYPKDNEHFIIGSSHFVPVKD